MQKEMESFKKELLEEIKKIPPARVSDIPIISTTSKSATHDTLPKPKVPKKRKPTSAPTAPAPAPLVQTLLQVSENTAFYLKMGTGNSAVILAEANKELAKARTEKAPVTKWRRTLSGGYLPVPFEYGWQNKMQ